MLTCKRHSPTPKIIKGFPSSKFSLANLNSLKCLWGILVFPVFSWLPLTHPSGLLWNVTSSAKQSLTTLMNSRPTPMLTSLCPFLYDAGTTCNHVFAIVCVLRSASHPLLPDLWGKGNDVWLSTIFQLLAQDLSHCGHWINICSCNYQCQQNQQPQRWKLSFKYVCKDLFLPLVQLPNLHFYWTPLHN